MASMLRAELWNVEKECEAWERERSVWVRERSVGCVLCHPLLLEARARAAARAGSRVLTRYSRFHRMRRAGEVLGGPIGNCGHPLLYPLEVCGRVSVTFLYGRTDVRIYPPPSPSSGPTLSRASKHQVIAGGLLGQRCVRALMPLTFAHGRERESPKYSLIE